jgi:hypothetical protein
VQLLISCLSSSSHICLCPWRAATSPFGHIPARCRPPSPSLTKLCASLTSAISLPLLAATEHAFGLRLRESGVLVGNVFDCVRERGHAEGTDSTHVAGDRLKLAVLGAFLSLLFALNYFQVRYYEMDNSKRFRIPYPLSRKKVARTYAAL